MKNRKSLLIILIISVSLILISFFGYGVWKFALNRFPKSGFWDSEGKHKIGITEEKEGIHKKTIFWKLNTEEEKYKDYLSHEMKLVIGIDGSISYIFNYNTKNSYSFSVNSNSNSNEDGDKIKKSIDNFLNIYNDWIKYADKKANVSSINYYLITPFHFYKDHFVNYHNWYLIQKTELYLSGVLNKNIVGIIHYNKDIKDTSN